MAKGAALGSTHGIGVILGLRGSGSRRGAGLQPHRLGVVVPRGWQPRSQPGGCCGSSGAGQHCCPRFGRGDGKSQQAPGVPGGCGPGQPPSGHRSGTGLAQASLRADRGGQVGDSVVVRPLRRHRPVSAAFSCLALGSAVPVVARLRPGARARPAALAALVAHHSVRPVGCLRLSGVRPGWTPQRSAAPAPGVAAADGRPSGPRG